jgi:hypothetical protein
MSRARLGGYPTTQPQTAVPPETFLEANSSGCLPGFMLPPLAVLLVGVLLAFLSGVLATPVDASSAPRLGQQNSGNISASVALSSIFTPEVQYWSGRIEAWAVDTGLDPNLIATVMQIESCGDPRARSLAGAMGLFQVMPYHFGEKDDPFNPEINAHRGLAYLKEALNQAGGGVRLTLAGYNGGIGVIGWDESAWPAETVRYVYWGNGIYQDAGRGRTESLRLSEWLAHGGASLCRQAQAQLGIP